MKKFVVVCGPGRSGTSLATSLVEACGFSFGKVNDFQHESHGGLRHGYGENPLTNAQGDDIERAINELETQGANAVKLIHLYAQWIPRLQKRGYDVKVVVTSRPEKEIWKSGLDIYPSWKPEAVNSICGTAARILSETQKYLSNPNIKAFELPFHKVVEKDMGVLIGLWDFLLNNYREDGNCSYRGDSYAIINKMKEIIKPEIVQHVEE